MAEKMNNSHDVDMLPIGQRIAWMMAIWALSVGVMVAVTMLIRAWLVG